MKKPRTTDDEFSKYLPLEAHLAYQACPDISQDDKDFEEVGFLAGTRRSTILHMPWSDVDFEGGFIIERYGMDGKTTKAGKPHRKPLLPALRQVLEARAARTGTEGLLFAKRNGKPYARNKDFSFKANLEKAGFAHLDLSFHSTRHGCAVWLLSEEGWRMEEVQRYLGHASISISITERYAKLVPGALEAKVAQTGLTLVAPPSSTRADEVSDPKAEGRFVSMSQLEKGRSGTDANGPFRGLAKRQQKHYFPNDHARVHASPCSRHVTRSHMIQDRHGTLTAPRRDNGTQTKRETNQLWLSFGFTSLGHRARLIAVSAPR